MDERRAGWWRKFAVFELLLDALLLFLMATVCGIFTVLSIVLRLIPFYHPRPCVCFALLFCSLIALIESCFL